MCTAAGPSEIVVPSIRPRDTSNELIKSNYELSDENKKKNAEIAARNKAKSLVAFNTGGDDSPMGTGVTIYGGTMQSGTAYGNRTGLDNLA